MINKVAKQIFIISLLLIGVFKYAVAQTEGTKQKDFSYTKFSISYLNNVVYMGRKDSLVTPYLTPTISYYDKSGFHISGSGSYLTSVNGKRFDLFSIDLGYDFNVNDQLSVETYANKSFYNQSSYSVMGDIKGSIGTDINYSTNFINLFIGGEFLFSSKSDIAINIGVSHVFEWGEKENTWSISPSALINFTTLGYYEGYSNRKYNRKGQSIFPGAVSSKSITTVDKPGITLMNYEFLLPISYGSKNWGAFLNTTFSMPKNPIYTTTKTTLTFNSGSQTTFSRNSTPTSEINLTNSLFYEVGMYFKL